MAQLSIARTALVLSPSDGYAIYYREALEHAGIPFDLLELADYKTWSQYDVLLFCGYGSLKDVQVDVIEKQLSKGGSIVCSGSTWGLDHLLGVTSAPSAAHPSNFTLIPVDPSHASWPQGAGETRFFGGTTVDLHGAVEWAVSGSGRPLATQNRLKMGTGIYFGVHVGQTIAQMQLGRSVESDGIGPSDGSCRLDDGLLRSEDGVALDFEKDRTQTEGGTYPFFSMPHADVVREMWIRLILQAISETGKKAAMTWYWPDNAEGAAVISIECEEFDPENVATIRKMLMMVGAPVTWLVTSPGYPLDVYRAMRRWDHEIGLLFQTDDFAGWTEERMKVQNIHLSRTASMPFLISSRPVDGRWRGLKNFYDLSESTGARLSLSKGGRQPGTSGFLFGSCHIFFPHKREQSFYRIAELPYQIYLPGVVTSDAAVELIVRQAALRHGCAHAAFKSDQIVDVQASAGLRQLITRAKMAKLEFMTAGEIYRFERGRRTLRLRTWSEEDKFGMTVIAETEMNGLTLMFSEPGMEFTVSGRRSKSKTVKRYGMTFSSVSFDIEAKTQAEIESKSSESRQAA